MLFDYRKVNAVFKPSNDLEETDIEFIDFVNHLDFDASCRRSHKGTRWPDNINNL